MFPRFDLAGGVGGERAGGGGAWGVGGAGGVGQEGLAGRRGEGFAAGGEHDVLAAGPELAAAAAAAAARPRELGESELIAVLCGWQRLASWAQAGLAGCLNELLRRRKVQSGPVKHPRRAPHRR